MRRAFVELSAFLEVDAPEGGHDPRLLGEEHGQRFVADHLHRERHGLTSLAKVRRDGAPVIVTHTTRRTTFNYARKILYRAVASGRVADIGLEPAFVAAFRPQASGTSAHAIRSAMRSREHSPTNGTRNNWLCQPDLAPV
ncbi:hypothetical protein [Nocardia sp. NPDC049707]|uniref:hypothetical protein n=1 Tax=Nocardia sp. NPDC049707 TaxID=3154735 RepID=UPI0034381C35